jgi:inosine-uridine nucleoside N-ribohydrolase
MAGGFPDFSEFNIKMDAAASQFVFDHWDTPVLFSGWEIGFKIRTGLPLINNETITNSPVKDVFRICIPMDPQDSIGRMSWDQTAVMLAVKGYQPWWTFMRGKITVANDGKNGWTTGSFSHYYLVEAMSPGKVQDLINKWMMHQPLRK